MAFLSDVSSYSNKSEYGYSMIPHEEHIANNDNESKSDAFNQSSGTTKVKYVPFNYVWQIKNFKYFCSMDTGEYVGSRPFHTTLDSKGMVIIWQLKVYPNGLDEQTKCKVVALLQCFSCSSPEAAKVEFSFHTRKGDHSIWRSSEVKRWIALKPNTHGHSVIGDQNEILQDLVDGTLVISCTGKVVDVFVILSNPKIYGKFGTVVPFKHTWKINRYMFGWLTSGEFLPSQFSTLCGDSVEVEWRLELFPKGLDKDNEDQVSIYLRCLKCNSPEPIIVQFWICLLDEEGDISYGKETEYVPFSASGKEGFTDFAKSTDFLKFKDEEDSVVILCKGEIEVNVGSQITGSKLNGA